MARQGHAFATAQGVRVVFAVPDEEKNPVLRDVPRDGKTMGEIVTKGNIVMKEVRFAISVSTGFIRYRSSISVTRRLLVKLFVVGISKRATLQS